MLGATVASIIAQKVQKVSIALTANYVLTLDSNFTNLDSSRPIEVTFTGTGTASSSGFFSVGLGDLSTYYKVLIIFSASCTVYAMGGNGGNGANAGGSPTWGNPGGTALNIPSTNSPTILSIQNLSTNGILAGGGGGGGGNGNTATKYNTSAMNCVVNGTASAPGGGGGGGESSLTNSSGGSGGTGGNVNGSAGGAGTSTNNGGAGGARGWTSYNPTSQCLVSTLYGFAGRAGGVHGSPGQSASNSGGPGSAGYWCNNVAKATWIGGYGNVAGNVS